MIKEFGPTFEGVWGVECKECFHSACGTKDPKKVEHAADCPEGNGKEGRLYVEL